MYQKPVGQASRLAQKSQLGLTVEGAWKISNKEMCFPAQNQAGQHSIMKWGGPHHPSLLAEEYGHLMREGIFFKCVAGARLTVLQWIAQCPRVYGQHKSLSGLIWKRE